MLENAALGRRGAVALGAGALLVSLLPRPAAAQMQPATQAAMAKVTGGKPVQEARVRLELPPIAENGNTVPMKVTVESPMTAGDFVKTVTIIADKNPTPDVATFHFTPACGRAQADTRMRLGVTQDVIALAETNAGQFFMTRAEVKVTIGGCGG
jgi:sulfur-oxidizing protein SoxY